LKPPALSFLLLISPLHDRTRFRAGFEKFLAGLAELAGVELREVGPGEGKLPSVVFVGTGGTEAGFRELAGRLRSPILLVSHPAENSLPSSLEILSWLRARGRQGIILHGPPERIARPLATYAAALAAGSRIAESRLGLIGKPSDWLIESRVDGALVEARWGCRIVEIPLGDIRLPAPGEGREGGKRFLDGAREVAGVEPELVDQAEALTAVLEEQIAVHRLDGITLRCFDLLESWGNTGCLALSRLNDEGIPAACEGDVPALFTMTVAHFLAGTPGFMANPAAIDPEEGEMVLAHCTVPLRLAREYSILPHFESGRGAAVRGVLPPGRCLLFKIGGDDLSRIFLCPGEIVENLVRPELCRTQIRVRVPEAGTDYLKQPLGNHLVVVPVSDPEPFNAFRSLFF